MQWPVWRLVTRRVATLQELETHWSITDLFDANDVLDALDEVQQQKT